jgi:hypothetical protein
VLISIVDPSAFWFVMFVLEIANVMVGPGWASLRIGDL